MDHRQIVLYTRARSLLKSRKLLGKSQAVCSPSCKELDAATP